MCVISSMLNYLSQLNMHRPL